MIGNGRQCDVPVTLSSSHRLLLAPTTTWDESLLV